MSKFIAVSEAIFVTFSLSLTEDAHYAQPFLTAQLRRYEFYSC